MEMEKESLEIRLSKILNNNNISIKVDMLFSQKCKDFWLALDSGGWIIEKSKTLIGLIEKLEKLYGYY